MKRIATLVLAATLGMFYAGPAFARTCPKLIKEGRDLLAKASLSKADATKIKGLLDESEKLHDSGDHGESVKKAKEALSLLKKK
ncbi:MAG TPA: hypothetical protein VGK77_10450 [Candidatus Binatia bacterium]|jgi:hypothetical protein